MDEQIKLAQTKQAIERVSNAQSSYPLMSAALFVIFAVFLVGVFRLLRRL